VVVVALLVVMLENLLQYRNFHSESTQRWIEM